MRYLLILFLSFFLLGASSPPVRQGDTQTFMDPVEFLRSVLFSDGFTLGTGGIVAAPVTETTTDVTLYVRTTGLDTNDCLSAGAACLTIQEAVDRVPKTVGHDVVIDVGEGNFAGFMLSLFAIEHPGGSLLVKGAYKAATVATGTNSGTSTSGDTLSLTDTGQTWTIDDLRSKLILVNGEYRYILNNTATVISFLGPFSATTSVKAYEIVEHASLLTSVSSANVYGMIESVGCLTAGNTLDKPFRVDNFQVNGQAGFYETVWNWEGQALSVSHIHGFDNYWGMGWEHVYGRFYVSDVWLEDGGNSYSMFYVNWASGVEVNRVMVEGSAQDGAQFIVSQAVCGDYFYANSNVRHGVIFQTMGFVNVASIFATGNAGNGLYVYHSNVVQFDAATLTGNGVGAYSSGSNHFDFDSAMVITGNTSHGMVVEVGTKFTDIDEGTISNNGGYGIYVDENDTGNRVSGSFINLSGTITIENNTLGGIILKNNSGAALTNVDGVNTGAYGLELEVGSFAIVTTDTGITGATGDATINDGTTTLTWATDFASNGDKVSNLSNFCSIERKD